jgi:alkanesulfonate monooxygenase SsuD/methylene tetrahydromethanopterin reductase-like flavin-dependent oxidoreductase (luciferase family)
MVAATMWWLSGADERRVNAACSTWLQHRGSLRTVLTESEEAVGRAEDAHAAHTGKYFNDMDAIRATLAQWASQSPRILNSLDRSDSASKLERGAASSFLYVESGLTDMRKLIEAGDPKEVADWLPEVAARFQNVDDVCLFAARGD